MVAAGEAGGVLDEILMRLATYIEKADALKRKVQGAMVYPTVVLSVCFGAAAFMLIFIIPTFAKMFTDFGGELPLPTKIVLMMSGGLQKFWWVIVLAGIGISVGYLVPWSMVPDVIELDELETGQRREGIFYGFFVFLQKMGLAVGLFISGWALELSGYINSTAANPDPVQPASALLAMRVLIGPVGAAVLLLSFLAVRAYPITREKHAAMRAELARRRAAGA
jgi:Na+/melibiose symporter-like transporter